MADEVSLESILATLPSSSWQGRAFRVMLNDYPPDRENSRGARWNPPGTAAVYTCLDPKVCIAEVQYMLDTQPRPVKADLRRTLFEIDVALAAATDLTPALPMLERIGITREQFFTNDMKVSQEIGRLATWFGWDGLFVPSARASGQNLVIYPGRVTEAYRFEVQNKRIL